MNKRLYRLVFNAARNSLVAAPESALKKSKSAGRKQGNGKQSFASLVLWLAATFVFCLSLLNSALAQAQIMPDATAPGNQHPTVLSTSNNVPLVNIQTPSAAGVSRNTYEQFDVGASGAVLNNSRTDVQTQLGGWVQGNPWLANGEARIILNEVNSNNPSQLKGFIEVGGQRAEVIIANPAGIEVNGAGFINTSRATLTTGTPQMNGGNLEGYRVLRGTVRVGGQGLDASLTDYTGILARAIEVNASIHAQQLDLVTGANAIDVSSSSSQQSIGTGGVPAFALDVSELGGMYAGQIRLVGTEEGLGVRHHGTMAASASDIHIDVNGQLRSAGNIHANHGDITIQTAQDQNYSGSVLAGENLTLHSGGSYPDNQNGTKPAALNNSGVLRAGQEASLHAGNLSNSGDIGAQRLDVEVANLNNSGALWQSGDQALNVQTSSLVNKRGGFLGRVSTQQGGQTDSSTSAHQSPGSDETNNSQASDGSSTLSQNNSSPKPPSAELAPGAVKVGGSLVNNAQGTIAAEGEFHIRTDQSLSNAGHIRARSVQSRGDWFENTAGTLQTDQLEVEVGTVNLKGGAVTAGTATLDSIKHAQELNAQLYALGDLRLSAERLSNAGEIQSGAASNITIASSLISTNTGTIAAADDLTIDAASVASSGTLAAGLNSDGSLSGFAGDGAVLSVTTTGGLTATGNNLAAGHLRLEGDAVDLSDSQTSAYTAVVTARDNLDTAQANVVTQKALVLQAGGSLDNSEGTLSSQQDDLSVQAHSLDNDQGTLLAGNDLAVRLSDALLNTEGSVYAGGNATLDTGALTNTGTIAAAEDLTIDAASVASSGTLAAGLNSDGALNAFASDGAALSVTTTGDFTGPGTNLAAGHLRLDGDGVDLGNSQISAYSAALTARDDLDTTQANVVTQEALALQAGGALDNSEGTLSSQLGELSVQARSLDNDQGTLLAGNDLAVTLSDALLNTDGSVYAGGNATLDTGALTNTGTIAAAEDLTIDAASVASSGTLAAGLNSDGSLNGFADDGAALSVTTTGDLSATGTNLAAGALRLGGKAVDLSDSQTSAFDADISAKDVLNTENASLISRNDINVGSQRLSNTDGTLYAGGSATLNTGVLTNSGTLAAADGLIIDAASVTSSGTLVAGLNQNGTLKSFADGGGALNIATTGGLSAKGSNLAAGRLTLEGANVDLSNSQTSAHRADVIARGDLTTGQASIVTEAGLTLQADDELDNKEGVLASKTGNLTIDSNGVVNTGGVMVAATGLDINANSKNINNIGGEVMAQGDMNLSTHGNILNTGGLVQSNAAVSLSADTLDNRQTSANTQGIVGNDVQVTANTVNNTEGQVLAGRDLAIAADDAIINTRGKLNAQRNLTLQDGTPSFDLLPGARTLIISNTDGVILANSENAPAGASVNITANALSLDGTLESGGDMALDLVGDLSTAAGQQVRTEGILSLKLHGDPSGNTFVNAGKWEGGKGLAVRADEIHNLSSGELRSQGVTTLDTTQTSGGSVTNRGLIDGADTRISTHRVDNVGSGRLYGDRIAIVASILNNREETVSGQTRAATIAARERLDIGTQHITNREGALLFSGGDMAIGGRLSPSYRAVTDGSANAITLNNNSATIESLGDMALAANTLRNTNEHFAMEEHFVGETEVTLIQPEGWQAMLNPDDLIWDEGDERPEEAWSEFLQGKNIAGYYIYHDGSETHNIYRWTQYSLTQKEYESRVVASDPSVIMAGGNLSLRGQNLLNDKSRIIVGQGIYGDIANLENKEALGEKRISSEGTAQRTNPQGASFSGPDGSGGIHYTYRKWHAITSYNPPDEVTTISFGISELRHNVATSGSGTHIDDKNDISNLSGVSRGDTGAAGSMLAEQSLSNTAQGVGQPNINPNALNTSAQQATQAPISADDLDSDLLDHANPSQGAQATAGLGAQNGPALLLPNSSLFTVNPGSNARYLVATDPQFANYRQWLSSDYLLSTLAYDPAQAQKRVGDGFYEQKLIREQVAALTGYRFLGDYRSDDEQYAALMNAGAVFARTHQLRPGIALTPAQTAQLTSDIVWLVTQTVQLPDGTTTTALMPKVYLAPRQGDLAANGELLGGNAGTLISARDVDLTLSGDLSNSGTIAGRKLVDITAQNLDNSGNIQGGLALINARQDINLEGGSINATTGMAVNVGRDLNITTTTHSATSEAGNNTFSLQGIDRVAGLYVNGEAGDLIASAGGTINLTGAQLHNVGSGVTQLSAGDNINLDTVEIGQSHDLNWRPNNYNRQSNSEEIGTVVTGGGDVSFNAGQDINLRAAQVDAQGALAVNAIGSIDIAAGQRSENFAEGFQTKSSGLFSSKTTTRRTSRVNTQALASELGGQTVAITSGQDIRLNGANVLADQDVGMHAGGNLTLDADQNTFSESHFHATQKSGLFSSGIGFTIGNQQQQSDAQSTATFAAPSTVGSLGGNVTLSAGDTYTQIGSDVLAPMGDITIVANTVNIQEARETRHSQTEQRFKQSGLSVSLSSPVVDTAQRLQGQVSAAGDTQSSRMQALAAANSALAALDVQQQLASGQGQNLSLNVSLGSSKSQSTSIANSDTARGATLNAGGNLTVHALGQGEGEGNINVQGSQLAAGNQMRLNATQDINLLASADTASNRSSHSSSSTNAGVGIGASGINLSLDASRAQGYGNGDSTTYNNTQLAAGNQVTLNSGGDTTLQGAMVSAPQITANIGGNLTIESLQDTATHRERHSSSGGRLSVPIASTGQFSASLNASRTKIDSDYQSVNEQSGFRAGDGGFQVNVEGLTTLTGGAITSTDVAVDAGNNHFTTAGQTATEALESGALTLSDIDNRASYEAESTSVGLSAGQGSVGLSGIGVGRGDGDASSTTLAAISGLAGDQDARTGDVETGIAPIFDADQVKQDVQAQAAIAQAFGSQASQLVGDLAQAKLEEAQDKRKQAELAQALGDNERAAQLNAQADQLQQAWGDTGTQRLAAHTAIGALTGGTAGATGAAVGTLSASAVADALNSAGLDGPLADSLIALASTAAGAATGGTQGGAAAFNEVVNNYLSHEQLSTARDELASCDGDSSCMADVVERYQATSQQQDEAATDACATDLAACQEHSLAAADGEYARYGDDALWDLPNEALPYMLSLFDENIGVQNAFGEATIARLLTEGGISPEMAAVLAAMPVGYNKRAANTGHFNEVHPRNIEEAKFLANAQATFADSSTWSGVIRHRDELVVQRSDIELSSQNIIRMRNGQAPFVRNVNGDWELLHLHHVGRQTGKMIEVTRSQNRYNTLTGGPLHIPGPGGPVRQPGYTQSYWQNRYQDFVNSGQINQ